MNGLPGSQAKIKTRIAVNSQRNFRGRIVGIEDDQVILEDRNEWPRHTSLSDRSSRRIWK